MMYQLDVHNQFNESLERFKSYDPHLKRLHNIPLVHHSLDNWRYIEIQEK